MRIAQTASATRSNNNLLAVLGKVGDIVKHLLRLGVELAHHGTHRYAEHKVFTTFTVFAAALAMRAALSTEVMLKTVVDERRELRVGFKDDIATPSAIAAVGTALGDVCLAPKRHAACAAIAAFNVDPAHIGELRHVPSFLKRETLTV